MNTTDPFLEDEIEIEFKNDDDHASFTHMLLEIEHSNPPANIFRLFYNALMLPILYLHEYLHALMAKFFRIKIDEIYISNINLKYMRGSVSYKSKHKSKTQVAFISLAPMLIVIVAVFLPFLTLKALPFLIWVIICLPAAVPSKADYILILYFEDYNKIQDYNNTNLYYMDDIYHEIEVYINEQSYLDIFLLFLNKKEKKVYDFQKMIIDKKK